MISYWYYYLHENGDIIGKSPIVVEGDGDYFTSPFVKKVWKVNLDERTDAWVLVIEALAMGARETRVKELATRWELNYQDSLMFIRRLKAPTEAQKKGFKIFVEKILKRDHEKYWENIKKLAENEKKEKPS